MFAGINELVKVGIEELDVVELFDGLFAEREMLK